MSSSCPEEGRLRALLTGEIPEAERVELERHLSKCAACRQRLDALATGGGSRLSGAREFVKACAAKHEGQAAKGDSPRPRSTILIKELQQASLAGGLVVEGAMIGRYKILEQVGEGGFGAVYVAEQSEPVKRRVALKIIKLGMDTKQVVARFEAERQALALMDHPNIAKVLDAGATESGRLFFVMELVRGIKVTDYCDHNKLSTAERLALFVQVCQAIQHAHQKGIIHRDIKPSNILVTLRDGVPVPKVIDFGIAKATQGTLTDKTVYTRLQEFIGTPAYMSPEQAEMTGLDMDTRSDIYSLGVLLYELLTGHTPFDTAQLERLGLDEIRRTIREQDPPRPSTRLHMLAADTLANIARLRQAIPPKLLHLIRGDLDWIVMKCLEKDRTRRYETANGIAMDIRRHLAHEPILARPPSKLYRFERLVRRNKLAFAASTTVVAALVVSLGIAVYSLAKEKIYRQRAEAAEQAQLRSLRLAEKRELTTRQNLYAVDMNLAQLALEADNFHRAAQLLERHRPAQDQADLRQWEWRYLWQFSRGDELFTLAAHSNVVTCAAVSPDGRLVASGSYDGTVRLWNPATRQLLATATPGETFCIAFSPDGKQIAAGGESGVSLWDASSLHPRATIPHNALVRSLAFTRNGQELAFLCGGGVIHFWELTSDKERTKFRVQPLNGSLRGAVAFSPDGALLAVGENSGLIRLLHADTGSEKAALRGHRNSVTALAFALDGRTLASSSWDHTARLWNVASAQEQTVFTNHTAWVSAVAFPPDGKTVVTASADQSIRVWSPVTGTELRRLQGHRGEVWALACAPDGSLLVSGGKDETVKFWRAGTASPMPSDSTLPERAAGLALSPDGRRLVLLTPDLSLRLVDAERGETIWELSGQSERVSALAFAPRQPLLATGDAQGRVQILELTSRRELRQLSASTNRIVRLHFSTDGRSLCSLDRLGIYQRWDVATGTEQVAGRIGHTVVDFSPDHQRLAFGAENRLHVLSLGTTNEAAIFPTQKEPIRWVAFAPDGQRVATGGEDGTARLWDAADGRELAVLHAHRLGVHVVAFSPDGRRLATGGGEGVVRLWDLDTTQEVLTLKPAWVAKESPWIEALGFSAEGGSLWALNRHSQWQLWRAPSMEEIAAAEALKR